ncbi:MAG: ImmA/IrrE family metallo-endopeptidase [Rhodospirillaceae bacterium]
MSGLRPAPAETVGTKYSLPEPCGLSKATIFALAERVVDKLQLKLDYNIEEVIERLGGKVHLVTPYSSRKEVMDGSIRVHALHEFDVYLADNVGPRRRRFTAAHELGHYFLHYNPKPELPLVGLKANREGTGRVEWEAHWFARALLMPEKEFIAQYNRVESNVGKLADVFGVSDQVCAIRIEDIKTKLG